MLLCILILPLFSSFFAGFFGSRLGNKGSSILTTSLIFCSFFLSFFNFYQTGFTNNIYSVSLCQWISSGIFNVNWGFLIDSLTITILIVVTSVSSLVHLYSTSYIEEDPHLPRFISYLSLFTFFILILVIADNLLLMFVGWEGVGLCSFLLINFWFTRIQANKAAIKAILVNRVGDFGLAFGIIGLFYEFGSVDYSILFSLMPLAANQELFFFSCSVPFVDFVTFCMFIGSVGKSAQLGLHTWLPDAIEGPTPVSALIHAATIVTAGVFLLVRCSPVFEFAPNVLNFITLWGSMTAFFAGITGLMQNDLKKVIAYSTCSQLGYIVFACGLSAYDVGLFHLANHAFFKAILFLTAGCIIHAINDEQDMRKIGGLVSLLPFCYSIIVIGSIALIGFPFLTGFYSKEVVLEAALSSFTFFGLFAYCLGVLAAFVTAFYSIRLIFLTFLSAPLGFKKNYEQVHEAPIRIALPVSILFLGSVFFGFFYKDLIIGPGNTFLNSSVFIFQSNYKTLDGEFLPLSFKLIPLVFSFIGMFSSFMIYYFWGSFISKQKLKPFIIGLYSFFNKKWLFDKLYNEIVNQGFVVFCYRNTYTLIDKGLLEFFGPYGASYLLYLKANRLSRINTGVLFHYTLIIVYGFFFIFLVSFFSINKNFFLLILAFFLIF